ncbi:flavin reductase family protein [Actinomadura rubrisoli]|uniref:Flavin reductase n=1 Tax=Actinomadura rubrisoli TaxID=2530368 RepID=A0A4R5CC23_9ACTN|nr:flavin reductase family protein [Actinomadura rubrisoli]TDD96336.1 flavin reductase [Actinomadura rubrisoli]
MSIETAHFRHVLGHVPTGVAVITAVASTGPAGFVVGTLTSVSLRPPLVSFCADVGSRAWSAMRDGTHFGVNVLAADQSGLCGRFARPPAERFDGVGWSPCAHGLPRLDGALAWLCCARFSVQPAGDHDLVLALVEELEVLRQADPLVFHRGSYSRPAMLSRAT